MAGKDKTWRFCEKCGRELGWAEWEYLFSRTTGQPRRWGRWQCPEKSAGTDHDATVIEELASD